MKAIFVDIHMQVGLRAHAPNNESVTEKPSVTVLPLSYFVKFDTRITHINKLLLQQQHYNKLGHGKCAFYFSLRRLFVQINI
jgi:hypothetical protein